jgi:hypothetical protein
MKKRFLIAVFYAKFCSLVVAQTLPTLTMGEIYNFAVNDTFVYMDSIQIYGSFLENIELKKTLYVILSRNVTADSISYSRYIKTQTKKMHIQQNYREDLITRQIKEDIFTVASRDSITHTYKDCSFATIWRGDFCFVRSLTTRQSTNYSPRKETLFAHSDCGGCGYPDNNYRYVSALGLVQYDYKSNFNNRTYKISKLIYYNKGGERWGDSSAVLFPSAINLVSFNANTDKNSVNLKWQTRSEDHIDHFEIERSRDTNMIWTMILNTKATQTSFLYSYALTDTRPLSGISYYRLKIVDSDNKVSYSKVQKVINGFEPYITRSVWVYPNPINEQLNIEIRGRGFAYKITDILGRTTLRGEFQDFIAISTSSLNKGVYILELTDKETGITETRHLVK